jgi:putative tryptophan/tyrosine transport system substrate-binding protein
MQFEQLKRREFITLLGGATVWPLAARGQQRAMPLIGVLYGVSAAEWADRMDAFRRGFGEAGFIEGRNVAIEYRWAEGQMDRIPWMAVDLMDRGVAVILMGGNTAAVRSMLSATQNIPIVFTTGGDPVAAGLVASLNRPGGNATGVTQVSTELGPKRLELLHELVPAVKKIGVLVNQNNRVTSEADIRTSQAAARRLGLELIVLNGGTESEIEAAFQAGVQHGAGAVYVGSDAFFNVRGKQIAALALRHSLPTMGPYETVQAGALAAYGANALDMYRQAGVYVGRILKGAKPGDLPVMQPTKFDLVINLKAARALGIEVPATLLARADEVIE